MAVPDCQEYYPAYNVKSPDYKDKTKRNNALESIQLQFQNSGIVMFIKDISTKIQCT